MGRHRPERSKGLCAWIVEAVQMIQCEGATQIYLAQIDKVCVLAAVVPNSKIANTVARVFMALF